MGKANSITLERDIIYIDDNDILLGLILAEEGRQRLRVVSCTKTTFFCFHLPYGAHAASVVVQISPFTQSGCPHGLYNVFVFYASCCAVVQDSDVYKHTQQIYNTYIRVVQIHLDEKCRKKLLPNVDSALSCQKVSHTWLLDQVNQPKRPRTTEDIASCLIKKILSGIATIKTENTPLATWTVENDTWLSHNHNKKELNQFLIDLESKFMTLSTRERAKAKLEAWTSWYHAACLSYIRYRRRLAKKNRRASAVYIIHCIVSQLLASDGIRSVAVILALAVKGYTLSEASYASEADQKAISETTAKGLHGKLTDPPALSLIPFPAILVTMAMKTA